MTRAKLVFTLLSPIADILAILTFCGVSATSISTTIQLNFNWFSIVMLLVSSLLLVRVVIERIKRFFHLYERYEVKKDLEKGINETGINKIEKIIPTTKTLEVLLKSITEKAQEWAEDVTIRSLNLYLDYNKTWNTPNIQVIYYSDWKKEQGTFYDGRFISNDFEEPNIVPVTTIQIENNLTPFFYLNPSWQSEVAKAFNSVSTKLSGEIKICIQQNNLYTQGIHNSISIIYYEGRVKKTKVFNLDNNFNITTK